MDLHGCKRAFLAKTINVYIGILKDRTHAQMTEVEIVPAANKRAPLRSLSPTIG
jgi:hypothetical protein